jgi:hypothetical protein
LVAAASQCGFLFAGSSELLLVFEAGLTCGLPHGRLFEVTG